MKNFPKIRALITGSFFMLAIAVLVSVASLPAFGQAITGTLRGTVTDPNGGVIAGATVTAKHQGTGVTSPTTTNGDGLYVIPNLPPGSYTVTVEPTGGFSKKAITDVSVPIGQTTDLSITLAVGSPTETVTVTSTGEEIITRDQAQISTTFESRKIEELPSNGAAGGIDTLALLAPGVVASRNSGVNTDGAGLSVNGNRGRSNNFQIDGSDNNDLSIGGPSLFVDNTSQVAEYQVITNNFSAQYGRNSGAVINIVTKSGGNEFHGDLFEYHQDAKHLNSLNNIERRSGKLFPNQYLYNAFGGTAGGPIWLPKFGEGGKSIWKGKDRAFFFFSYQGVRNPAFVTARGANPAILASEFGRLGTAFPGNNAINAIRTLSAFASPLGTVHPRTDQGTSSTIYVNPLNNAISPTPAAGFVGPFLGRCTVAACGFASSGPYDVYNINGQIFQAAFPERDFGQPFTENEWSYRFTVKASSKDNVDFRHLKQTQIFANNGGGSNGFTYDVPATSKNLGGTWTRQMSNSLVNEFKATTQDLNVEFGGADASLGSFAIPKPAAIGTAITNITFGGITGVGSGTALQSIGPATNIPQGRLVTVYQFADTISLSKGRHSVVMGAEFKHLINKVPFLPLYNGQFTYATVDAVTRLVNNAPSAISLTAGEPVTTYTENDQYYFVQDDFKLRPNLTLNLGVRYEYTGQPINQLHDITLAREQSSKRFFDPTLPIDVRVVPFIPPDKNNWAPRIGFAYTPHWGKKLFGEEATVIRGGFAIAYDPAFYNILLNVQNVAPYSAALALSSANALSSTTTSPLPLPANPIGNNIQAIAAAANVLPLGQLNPLFLSQTRVASNFHSPYSEQFSFGLQRQVNRSNVFEVRYVGTRGVGLFQSVNDNFFIRPLVNGFSRTKSSNVGPPAVPGGPPTAVSITYAFPSFANLLPAGVTAQSCTNLDSTKFVDESVCDGRLKRQAGITTRQNSASSIYHSMQARYSGRFMKNALSLNASYTFSKTIDNASEIFAFADIASPNAQNPFDLGKAERALSNLDRPHAFSLSFIYDVPWAKEQRGFVGHLLGGWQLNGVQVTTSGNPFTPTQSANGTLGLGGTYLTAGERPFIGNVKVDPKIVGISAVDAYLTNLLVPTVANGLQPPANSTVIYNLTNFRRTGLWVPVSPNDVHFIVNGPGAARILGTPFGTMPRNHLRGPGINQLNMSVFKTTKIAERLKVQFQVSAFNVLNHPNPGYGVNAASYLPNATLENAGVAGNGFNDRGDIALARRVVQFGLRFIY
jgi:outer membrane receptor protein involved in Fe transport